MRERWDLEGGTGRPAGRELLLLADGRELPLAVDDLYVGRVGANDIVVDDPSVADYHARLTRFPEGWILTDLGSSGGTSVNGQRVAYPVVVAPGDRIQLGRLRVALQAAGAVRPEAPREPVPAWAGGAGHAAEAEPATLSAPRWPGVPLITVRQVVKSYPASAGPLTVLRGVSLTVQAGEFVAIVGPSGCGKSTLLNVLTGIDRPDSGEVVIAGQDIHQLSDDALTRWRGRTVGIVFQFFQLLPTLTVAENVMLPMAFCRTYPGAERWARALEVLDQVGMAQAVDRLPNTLSGGEQQRVAIARALANGPRVLVADEPTGNLDSRTGWQIFELCARLAARGTTVLMVTHDPALAREAPRRIELLDGEVVSDTYGIPN